MYAYYKTDQHSEADTGTVLRMVERQGRPTGNSKQKLGNSQKQKVSALSALLCMLVRWCVGALVRGFGVLFQQQASPGADSTAVERVCVRACARVSTVRWFVGSWVRGFIQQQACQLFSAFQEKKWQLSTKKISALSTLQLFSAVQVHCMC